MPSRLIGEKLRVHIYHDLLELYLGMTHVFSTQRVYASKNKRVRNVDYRHVIASLERKPQAFRYSQLRDDLLPTDAYKAIWKWLDNEMEPRSACKAMVEILALAKRADCEEALGRHFVNNEGKPMNFRSFISLRKNLTANKLKYPMCRFTILPERITIY